MKINMINFEKVDKIPLYLQIYQKIQHDILHGYLKKGDQLPSIRKAVELFKVSKTSVEKAYEKMLMEGMIISIPQKGYFVDVNEDYAKLRKEILHTKEIEQVSDIRYDFRPQSMDKGAFDIGVWKKYIKDVLDHHQELSMYGDAQGEKQLRLALAQYAYMMRGVLCNMEQIIVGASFQSLFYILCGLLQKPCMIGMERDDFAPLRSVCEDYGNTFRIVDTDEDGINIDALYQSDVNVLYLQSFRTGTKLGYLCKKRRNELLKWAKEKNAYILEDDHNGELYYQSKVRPAIQGYDTNGRVIYVGSFSKIILPSFRISYMVLPKELQDTYKKRKQEYSPTSSKIEQFAFAQYIQDGHLERQVKRLRKRYAQKSKQMQEALLTKFSKDAIFLDEHALCFVLKFPESINIEIFMQHLVKKGIRFSLEDTTELKLSFSAIPIENIKQAIQELYTIILLAKVVNV